MEDKKQEFKWNICGHEKIVNFLESSIKNQKISQAYLFYGPESLGKYSLAKEFGKAILCGDSAVRPCQKCHSCSQIEKGSHFDFFELSRIADEAGKLKKDISIEHVRDLISRLKQGSLLGGYKIAIIRGAQHLNLSAANALLKTLEEPSSKTVIILTADDISRLPKTVASRCQTIKFLPVATAKIENFLIGAGASSDEAKIIARSANGAPGRAINFHYDKDARDRYFKNVDLFLKLISQPLSYRWKIMEGILPKDDIVAPDRILDDFAVAARDVMLFANANEMLVSNFTAIGSGVDLSRLSVKKSQEIIKKIKSAKQLLAQNIGIKNVLENLIITLPR